MMGRFTASISKSGDGATISLRRAVWGIEPRLVEIVRKDNGAR